MANVIIKLLNKCTFYQCGLLKCNNEMPVKLGLRVSTKRGISKWGNDLKREDHTPPWTMDHVTWADILFKLALSLIRGM